mgnify:CR=1 FL=1|jgi:hypothetical protein
MKTTLICILCFAIFADAYNLQHRKDTTEQYINNKRYIFDYDTYGFADEHFIVLSNVNGIADYTCNIDLTEIHIMFSGKDTATDFMNSFTFAESFLVEGGEFKCIDEDGTRSMIRRVMYWNYTSGSNSEIDLRVVPTRYDEVFQNATASLKYVGEAESNDVEEEVCIGVNTNDCSTSSGQIPIYSNKYVTLSCDNCFMGFDVELFLDVEISLWHLKKLAGGFKNINVNGALEFDMTGHASWSTGVNKQIEVVAPTTILNFNIGPVPIRIWFEIPLQVTADVSFNTNGNAKIGALADWNIGDAYIQWDPNNHWSTTSPSPVFNWKPLISGSANFDVGGNIGFNPTIVMHLDNLFDYTLKITTGAEIDVSGSTTTKQICASSDADIDITGAAELHINIPFVHLKDKQWGPYDYYQKTVEVFPKTCVASS